jgi:nicotinamidase/pyrazinamidase
MKQPIEPHQMSLTRHDAVLAVTIQKDYGSGGPIDVPEADDVVGVMNRWLDAADRCGALAIFQRDWHPADHCSFQSQGGDWPSHCVRWTPGAEFHDRLRLPPGAWVLDKGQAKDAEESSAFENCSLAERLRHRGIERIWIGGLGLDLCVRATALDAVEAGFRTHLIEPACRAMGDHQCACQELREAGVVVNRARQRV